MSLLKAHNYVKVSDHRDDGGEKASNKAGSREIKFNCFQDNIINEY